MKSRKSIKKIMAISFIGLISLGALAGCGVTQKDVDTAVAEKVREFAIKEKGLEAEKINAVAEAVNSIDLTQDNQVAIDSAIASISKDQVPDAIQSEILADATKAQAKIDIETEAKGYDAVCDLLDVALKLDKSGEMPFDSLVIDGSTGLRGLAMNKSMEITYATVSNTDKTAMKKYRDHGIALPHDNDWGGEQSLIWKFVNWCFSLDKHFNLITHVWREEKHNRQDRTVKLLGIKPAFTGKQRDDLPTLFDNVWYFTVEGGKRSRVFEAQTQRDEIIEARTRLGGVLPINYRDVNFADAIKKFQQAASA